MANLFKQAFNLMWYGCTCGHRCRAWNNRNGDAPAAVNCPSCAGLLVQVEPHLNFRVERHKPHTGQLVFQDMSLEDAEAVVRRRIGECEYEVDEVVLQSMIKSTYGEGRTPLPFYYRPGDHIIARRDVKCS